jgi:hypothetical protein
MVTGLSSAKRRTASVSSSEKFSGPRYESEHRSPLDPGSPPNATPQLRFRSTPRGSGDGVRTRRKERRVEDVGQEPEMKVKGFGFRVKGCLIEGLGLGLKDLGASPV